MLTFLIAATFLGACDSSKNTSDAKAEKKEEAASEQGAEAGKKAPLAQDPVDEVAQGLSDEAAKTKVLALREARGQARESEQFDIERRQALLFGAFTEGCNVSSVQESFTAFQQAESTSLANDRAYMKEMLQAFGPDGRSKLWEATEPSALIVHARAAQAVGVGRTVPAWSDLDLDAKDEVRIRRLLLGMQYKVEGFRIDTEAQLTSFRSLVDGSDPAQDASIDTILTELARIDESLLASQASRFKQLESACVEMGDEAWLSILERGFVRTFLGSIGGAAQGGGGAGGKSGQQGGGQMGGGQMGGGQMGGGQMGGGQMGGGQMGGGQMGGGQMGGGQMGGGQMGGGQMGGGQMGGGAAGVGQGDKKPGAK